MKALKTLDEKELAQVNGGAGADAFQVKADTSAIDAGVRDPRTDIFHAGYVALNI
jgi:bacteriocin-like protein